MSGLAVVQSALLAILVAGCGSSDFKGGGGSAVPPKQTPANPNDMSEEFTLDQGKSAPIDITWVIDNSSSMTDKIEKVRLNFDNFITSLQSVDTKVILLSQSKNQTPGRYGNPALGLNLPAKIINDKERGAQVDYPVGSLDGAWLAAQAMCPPSTSTTPDPFGVGMGTPNTLCGQTLQRSAGSIFSMGRIGSSQITGALVPLFRPNAARVFVFVTDDESQMLSGADFVKVATASANGNAPKVFAFRGQADRKCTIAAPGVQYDAMIAATGGAGYDICEADWSGYFSKLTQSITLLGNKSFTLKKQPIAGSIRVTLDGQELTPDAFTVNGMQVSLTKAPDTSAQRKVKIAYKVNP